MRVADFQHRDNWWENVFQHTSTQSTQSKEMVNWVQFSIFGMNRNTVCEPDPHCPTSVPDADALVPEWVQIPKVLFQHNGKASQRLETVMEHQHPINANGFEMKCSRNILKCFWLYRVLTNKVLIDMINLVNFFCTFTLQKRQTKGHWTQ